MAQLALESRLLRPLLYLPVSLGSHEVPVDASSPPERITQPRAAAALVLVVNSPWEEDCLARFVDTRWMITTLLCRNFLSFALGRVHGEHGGCRTLLPLFLLRFGRGADMAFALLHPTSVRGIWNIQYCT